MNRPERQAITRRSALDPDLSMDKILRLWPATIRVLLRHKVLCIGCPLAVFHTVADACIEHCLNDEAFVTELEQAISESGPAQS
jgi:hybrid cluster-associated redox disulfide protein